jgi:hypothetical protein
MNCLVADQAKNGILFALMFLDPSFLEADMSEKREPDGNPASDERPSEQVSGQKPPWVKPQIRSSGGFDMQALACPPEQQSAGFPPCLGGIS